MAYFWPLCSIPPLNTFLGAVPHDSDALFLHDLALHPDAVGTDQAAAIVERFAKEAANAGVTDIALVAVNGTTNFWKRRGFVEEEVSPALQAKLAGYGDGACYMRRRVRKSAALLR